MTKETVDVSENGDTQNQLVVVSTKKRLNILIYILYYIILYYIILYYIISYHIILYYIVLYYIILFLILFIILYIWT
jgi:hypothetical protein